MQVITKIGFFGSMCQKNKGDFGVKMLIWEWTYSRILKQLPQETPEGAFWGRSNCNHFKDWKISQSAENII